MIMKIDCPSELYNMNLNDRVFIKRIYSSDDSDFSYLGCVYNDKVIGMCDEIQELEALKKDDTVTGKVLSITIYNGSSTIIIELL